MEIMNLSIFTLWILWKIDKQWKCCIMQANEFSNIRAFYWQKFCITWENTYFSVDNFENHLSLWLLLCKKNGLSSKFCGHCISRTNAQKLMKLYIQLQIDIIWNLLDFGVYCSTGSFASEYFSRIPGFLYF